MSRKFFIVNSPFDRNRNALRKIDNTKQLFLFGCDLYHCILPNWQKQFPKDESVLNTLRSIEKFLFNLINVENLKIVARKTYVPFKRNSDKVFPGNVCEMADGIFYLYHLAPEGFLHTADIICRGISNIKIKKNQWDFIHQIYLQTFKPKYIIIPKLPLFQQIVTEIVITRDFSLYNILIDAIVDHCNIEIKTPCSGLSNWLLFELLVRN